LAKTDKNAALGEVAKQFESMLVRMMMKSMREANAVFAEGNMLASPSSDMYQQMYDDQLAVSLTKGKGMGLGDVMVRQLQQRFGEEEKSATERPNTLMMGEKTPLATEKASSIERLVTLKASVVDSEPEEVSVIIQKQPIKFDGSVSDFVSKVYDMAQQAAEKLNVNAKTLLAQAGLETGWGKKVITSSSGESSLNLFNIKAGKDWQGESVTVSTLEFENNLPIKQQADFRSYSSIQQSFDDYVDFVMGRGRYEKALAANGDEQYIKEIAAAGYATDPEYANKVWRIANSESMQQALASIEVN
jgi:flagellar protein FlgJ